MKLSGQEDFVIRRIHRNALFLLVAITLAGSLAAITIRHGGLLGPIVENSEHGYILRWSLSDHKSDNSVLQNSLFANDAPKYGGGIELNLKRSNDGGLQALPRYQGTLEYHVN